MRTLLITILPLIGLGCAAHDAGTALEITARSTANQPRLWSTVVAVVRTFARERGFTLEHDSRGASAKSQFDTYLVEPPNQPAATTVVVYREPDRVTIDISEIGVCRPSRKHLEIQRALRMRLEAVGLIVSQTDPSIVITF